MCLKFTYIFVSYLQTHITLNCLQTKKDIFLKFIPNLPYSKLSVDLFGFRVNMENSIWCSLIDVQMKVGNA